MRVSVWCFFEGRGFFVREAMVGEKGCGNLPVRYEGDHGEGGGVSAFLAGCPPQKGGQPLKWSFTYAPATLFGCNSKSTRTEQALASLSSGRVRCSARIG